MYDSARLVPMWTISVTDDGGKITGGEFVQMAGVMTLFQTKALAEGAISRNRLINAAPVRVAVVMPQVGTDPSSTELFEDWYPFSQGVWK